MTEIKDARGLACPEPVLMVKNEIDKLGGRGTIKVLVNTVAAKENISRLAKNQQWSITIIEEGEDWLITLSK
ncbi:MAG: sulfur transfer protein SirA [Pelotomaculum sp. PtaB.Bin013]|uniref:Sulfurtransferase TusA family protein n=1 Tax=Pelotomaculum isophthalicicum JI TaxID=947010 RepID=A0A9X4H142_9FIRM|nr:sulfurtransferase TusA family protein [Pelotomaculum isophthalicicum]MDF9407321.1 sulfurtransferase TusA family protein [Pelotomaculum isophthalicicum JI]OPX90627.1 MAG: sulfur transfer protein SirA [Pelotomaculum sp. PtaB.Bin013]